MRVVRFHQYGGPEVLRAEQVERPEPGQGELLVQVGMVGVTLPTVRLTHGGPELPHAPGGDVVGRVAAIGAGVEGWQVGQRVVGLAFAGAYAEFATVSAAFATPVPEDIAEADALVLVRSGQVAFAALHVGGVRAGDEVLVTGAAGGVGHVAVQLAKALGAKRVLAAVGGAGKAEFLRGLGADEVLTYQEIAGDTADLVLDGVGGEVLQHGLRALRPLGRLVTYNAVGGPLEVNELRMRTISVIGLAMAHFARLRPEVYAANRERLWDLVRGGALRPAVHGVLPLAEAAQAHRIIESRANLGKVVLSPTAC
ncbi:zinc-binding dehydrogenase [Kutzneria viridogrisea]|uniref:Enoyl reductase (ER) domain-containing protein n=2 Tax=Kutzneria TaxID=43356 RepID=W5WLS4_9PSEU|nr:zinc-binding dehydrogenase [Kutzneria albida]AHI02144.1 hypothetical protein KALB_8787 [Kutzneria albida DSM 43870]MBA8929293.1 NADPH:quinone reductase-like Zn-dependent oxidoreductase [Kutzneria viridogrisea]